MAQQPASAMLPPGLTLLERGWLSSNNLILRSADACALIDSGYATHAAQTLALVQTALGERTLDLLVNTHLHSDHCGGNAALQAHYSGLRTLIPPGHAQAVQVWDTDVLTYAATGQTCPRFGFSATLEPGRTLDLGSWSWQVHAAPGHDPHSVLLFEPTLSILLSADALWERGFGVVFPELEGEDAFEDVRATLDLIESLAPRIVIPGHGPAFVDLAAALARARARLDGFVREPARHVRYAAKVLLKFKLLEQQSMRLSELQAWAGSTPYLATLHARHFSGLAFDTWVLAMLDELATAGAVERTESHVLNQ